MSSRAAELASAILIGGLVGIFAGAYLITMPYAVADDCLTAPKGDAPQGQHWYYRIERGTKRHCWYLRSELEKVSRVAASERSSSAKTASRKQDAPAQRLVADAHAELPSLARIEDNTSTVAARPALAAVISNNTAAIANTAVVDDNSSSANVISRWPEPIGVNSSASPLPDSTGTTVVAAAQPDTGTDQATDQASDAAEAATSSVSPTSDPATASAAVVTPIGKYSGSLQELMVVAFAALALAGLSGSAVYRLASLGRSRRRYGASRRSADWQQQPKKKKSREVRPVEPRPVSMRPESFAPKPTPKPAPHPASRPQLAPEPSFATRSDYAPRPDHAPGPDYAPESDYAPVSQYAPKPRATPRTRELEESFESIEQLLMRLAK